VYFQSVPKGLLLTVCQKQPVEALFRSLFLVLLDNATAEYTFITGFFSQPTPSIPPTPGLGPAPMSPAPNTLAPLYPDEMPSSPITPEGHTPTPRARTYSTSSITLPVRQVDAKEQKGTIDAMWKSVLEPVLAYIETFVKASLEPAPPAVVLLTMIRLAEETMAEAATRGCGPLERAIFGWRLQMWPMFQRSMTEHVDAVKKLVDGSAGVGGFFSRSTAVTDASLADICQKYIAIFASMIALTAQEEETMIFSKYVHLPSSTRNCN
jgi:hypothetical protein